MSIQWRSRAGLDRAEAEMSWAEVAAALQLEDSARRQSNTSHPEALLPLGWTRGKKDGRDGRALPAFGSTPSRQDPGSSSRGPASSSGKRKASPSRTPSSEGGGGSRPTSPTRAGSRRGGGGEGGSSAPSICWHCLKAGHRWEQCRSRPQGWKPSPDARARAEAMREEYERRRQQSDRDKASHAARSAAQRGSTPSEGRASGDL